MLYVSVSTSVGTGTIKATNGITAAVVDSVTAIRETWSAVQPTGQRNVGRIQHDIRETTTYPNGPAVERIRHYDVYIYDKNAQLPVPPVKGATVDITV